MWANPVFPTILNCPVDSNLSSGEHYQLFQKLAESGRLLVFNVSEFMVSNFQLGTSESFVRSYAPFWSSCQRTTLILQTLFLKQHDGEMLKNPYPSKTSFFSLILFVKKNVPFCLFAISLGCRS